MSSNKPLNLQLYARVKAEADQRFKKHGAFKSGWIVKTYKDRGGKYQGTKTKGGLTSWFKENWINLSGKGQKPVLRPTVRVSKKTPLTVSEISKEEIKRKILEKQATSRNLKPFQKK